MDDRTQKKDEAAPWSKVMSDTDIIANAMAVAEKLGTDSRDCNDTLPGVEDDTCEVQHRKNSINQASSHLSFSSDSSRSRKHLSAPSSLCCISGRAGQPLTRNRFEKRQKWSTSKQESVELPDDLSVGEDVFSDPRDPKHDRHQRCDGYRNLCQRSFSVPATLPDVVQEANTWPSDASPDVLLKGENEERSAHDARDDTALIGAKLSSKRSGGSDGSAASAEFCISDCKTLSDSSSAEEHSLKQLIEGNTCYNLFPEHDRKRRKSVSFDMAASIVSMVSARGQKARSHFRSSGYGSQSEGSQHSQRSDNTSHEGSVMSDDVLIESGSSVLGSMEKSSFETGFGGSTELCTSMDQECSPTLVDGSIDDSDSGTQKGSPGVSGDSEHFQTVSGSGSGTGTGSLPFDAVAGGTDPQHLATAPLDDNVPYLSIFEQISVKETSEGSVGCSGLAGADFSYLCNKILEDFENAEVLPQLPFQQPGPSENIVGPFVCEKGRPDSQNDRFSPTSVQRELFMKLYSEKMEKFDPTRESLSDLFDWIKNNLGEALTPSPKSPFFAADGSAQNFTLPPSIANALGIPGDSHRGTASPSSIAHDQACGGRDTHRDTEDLLRQPAPQEASYQPALPTVVAEQQSMPLHLESSVGLPSGASLSTGISDSHLDQVMGWSQCADSRCSNDKCLQWKERVQRLKDASRRGENLSDDSQRMLKLLCGHYQSCDQPNCQVPWCRFICRCYRNGGEITLQAILSALGNPVHTLMPADLNVSSFCKLSSDWPIQRTPREWEEWLLLCPMSASQMTVRAVPTVLDWPDKHWAVKMTNLHEGENQLDVLKCLRDLQHQHVVPHLWAAADRGNDLLLVCTEYQAGISMEEYLCQKVQMTCSQTCRFFLQILSAVKRIHTLGIVYLNWASSNFILEKGCERLKMTNFTNSVKLSRDNGDVDDSIDFGNIKLSLPVDVVPPELLVDGGELTYNTDSWGLACILHEMLTGERPWHHLRHDRQEDIWRQIKRDVHPTLSAGVPNCMKILMSGCFKRCPTERFSEEDLVCKICAICTFEEGTSV